MAKQKKAIQRDANSAAINTLAQRLGFAAEKRQLLLQALTHPAYYEGNRRLNQGDNQRLEFLGDAVLDLLVGEYLYRNYPEAQEGDLSKMRAYIVCEASLAEAALDLGLDQALRLGRGSEAGGDRRRPSVLADAYEAMIGAVYVAYGMERARQLLLRQVGDRISSLQPEEYADKKSLLQELVQANGMHGVSYRLLNVSGPDHEPRFESGAYCGKLLLGKGQGGSKKESEVAAAVAALTMKEKWLSQLDQV